jgi:hypothetical protein
VVPVEDLVEAAMSESLRFEGLQPLEANIEVIDIETPFGAVDLHNDCTLESTTLTCEPSPRLEYSFFEDKTRRRIVVSFYDVRDLEFRQDNETVGQNLWPRHEVETFFGLEYFQQAASAVFEVRTIVGNYTFTSNLVKVGLIN